MVIHSDVFVPAVRVRTVGRVVVLAGTLAWLSPAYQAGLDRDASIAPDAAIRTEPMTGAASVGITAVARSTGRSASEANADGNQGTSASELRLTGIIASSAANIWRAIIAGPSGEERTYGIGDVLPDGSALAGIEPDHVVVTRSGRQGLLSFLVQLPGQASIEGRVQIAPSTAAHDREVEHSVPSPASVPMMVRATPVLLLQWLPIQPEMNGDLAIGYRVGQPSDRSLMNEVGLAPDDVITAINDVQLGGSRQDAWMLSRSSTPSELRLTVWRHGGFRSITY